MNPSKPAAKFCPIRKLCAGGPSQTHMHIAWAWTCVVRMVERRDGQVTCTWEPQPVVGVRVWVVVGVVRVRVRAMVGVWAAG